MTLGERIAAEARALVGVRFRHAGRDRTGLDCAGLLAVAWMGAGLEIEDYPPYSRDEGALLLVPGIERHCERHDGLPEIGDTLLVRIKGLPLHCGIYSAEDEITHASDRPRVERVVTQRFAFASHRSRVTVYRWRGLR